VEKVIALEIADYQLKREEECRKAIEPLLARPALSPRFEDIHFPPHYPDYEYSRKRVAIFNHTDFETVRLYNSCQNLYEHNRAWTNEVATHLFAGVSADGRLQEQDNWALWTAIEAEQFVSYEERYRLWNYRPTITVRLIIPIWIHAENIVREIPSAIDLGPDIKYYNSSKPHWIREFLDSMTKRRQIWASALQWLLSYEQVEDLRGFIDYPIDMFKQQIQCSEESEDKALLDWVAVGARARTCVRYLPVTVRAPNEPRSVEALQQASNVPSVFGDSRIALLIADALRAQFGEATKFEAIVMRPDFIGRSHDISGNHVAAAALTFSKLLDIAKHKFGENAAIKVTYHSSETDIPLSFDDAWDANISHWTMRITFHHATRARQRFFVDFIPDAETDLDRACDYLGKLCKGSGLVRCVVSDVIEPMPAGSGRSKGG